MQNTQLLIKTERLFLGMIVVLVIVSTGLRLIALDADFPTGMTWSGVLYSDEGWYTSAATNFILTGSIYQPGDFNPIVALPVMQLVQAVALSVIGASIVNARLVTLLFFVLLILVVFLIVRAYSSSRAALFAVVVLATNYIVFAFSRLAILDIPMLSMIVASMYLVSLLDMENYRGMAALSGAVLAIAILTKTTAIFAIPLLLFLIWLKGISINQKIISSLLLLAVSLGVVALYYLIVGTQYSEDLLVFIQTNRRSFTVNPKFVIPNFISTLRRTRLLDGVLYSITLVITISMFVLVRRYRRNPLVQMSVLWIFIYAFQLSTTQYQPPRYFLTLIIPIGILFGIAVDELLLLMQRRWMIVLGYVLIFLVISLNLFNILNYLLAPSYTFITMGDSVRELVGSDDREETVLLGNLSNTLALMTGIPAVNDKLGTRDLTWRTQNYLPTHYVSVGVEKEILEQLSEEFVISELGAYDVLNNYIEGKQIHLYKLESSDS